MPSFPPRIRRFRGMVLPMVLGMLVVVGVLALQFYQMAMQARATAFRFEKSEIARQLAESATDEAIIRVWKGTIDHNAEISLWFLKNSKELLTGGKTEPYSLLIPVTDSQARGMVHGFSPSVKCTLSLIDFRNYDRKSKALFFPTDSQVREGTYSDGIGTFEIAVTAQLQRSGSPAATCNLTRHHDFKIVSMVSHPDHRKGFVQNFILDYALFIRRGLEEFRGANQQNPALNNSKGARIILGDQEYKSPARPGKVLIGGTEAGAVNPDDYVFLNVPITCTKHKDLLPSLEFPRIKVCNTEECYRLFSFLQVKDKKSGKGADGVQGIFEAAILPFPAANTPATDEKGMSIKWLESEVDIHREPWKRNTAPWALQLAETEDLLANPEYAEAILEGALRQRFLYYVRFFLDFSNVEHAPPDEIEAAKKLTDFSCLPLSKGEEIRPNLRKFLEDVKQFEDSRKEGFPLISKLDDSYTFKGGQKYSGADSPSTKRSFAIPTFYSKLNQKTTAAQVAPYLMPTLFHRMMEFPESLQKTGVYDPGRGVLHMRGINRILSQERPLELQGKNNEPLTFFGTGVIMSYGGIRIKSGIKKGRPGSDDFLVLYARNGNIWIDTSEEIQATLIAIEDRREHEQNYRIIPSKNINITGGVIVDYLDSYNWPAGDHRIRFDPVLTGNRKEGSSKSEDLFQVLTAPQISFQRLTEGE